MYTGEYTQKRELPVGRLNKLTAIAVAKKAKPGAYGDGGGLYLRVESNGVKGWFFRYKRNNRRWGWDRRTRSRLRKRVSGQRNVVALCSKDAIRSMSAARSANANEPKGRIVLLFENAPKPS